MPLDAATIVSLIGALGLGSVIGQWFGGAKDRRAARAAVLKELAAVEAARWWDKGPDEDSIRRTDAIRALETAALVGRVPRSVVRLYAQVATAAHWYVHAEVEMGKHPEETGLDGDLADLVLDAAELVSRAAWSTPVTRWLWLARGLRRVDAGARSLKSAGAKQLVLDAKRYVR